MTLLQLIAHLKEVFETEGNLDKVIVNNPKNDCWWSVDSFDIKVSELEEERVLEIRI